MFDQGRLFFLLATFVAGVSSIAIDNHLLGDPQVDCQDTMVSLTFKTEKPFTGRIYVKGLADDNRCSRNFATNADQSTFNMMVQNGDCAMARQRVTGNLEGIVFSLTIVVSFHGTFVTKVDRAYRCMCFFRNIKRVTNLVDMSAIGTTELLDTAKMPTCTYTIRSGSVDGPELRYGKVGDKIYHVWMCDDDAQGMLIHSCWVNDGRGNKFDLLDIDGCAVDPIIQPDVKYDQSLTKASVETHGYKFSDTSVLNYQCVIELCKKAQGECDGTTPPSCGRGKRSVNSILAESNAPLSAAPKSSGFDVLATVDILDTLDAESVEQEEQFLSRLNAPTQRYSVLAPSAPAADFCLGTVALGTLVGLSIVLFLASVVAVSLLWRRSSTSH